MQKAPVADNKKYSSKVVNCCAAIETLDKTCNTLHFLSDALVCWDTTVVEFSENSAHQIGALLFNTQKELQALRDTICDDESVGELLECEEV
ncbi:hypothetical protein AB835_04725 [Candidatus Endobugula sertula]|uniref:Uncharacterized protein n=1 Tax=Candidatus Endobugula sertula TaxID=62101 RepID=A0A1D2QRI5_9GAMM|nr:hypothetical protein AB835_04725 [Candidatus Endobugula sertula]